MRSVTTSAIAILAFASMSVSGASETVTPFKLGTVEVKGKEFVGLVLGDKRVLDLTAANGAYERRNSQAAKVRAPQDMKELISRYEQDLGPRLRALAAAYANAEP